MVSREELLEIANATGLSAPVVEKDYVLGWILRGISQHAALRERWIFKGGTCLKKCYFETYRFSEDLDFTLRDQAHIDEPFLRATFGEIAQSIRNLRESPRSPIMPGATLFPQPVSGWEQLPGGEAGSDGRRADRRSADVFYELMLGGWLPIRFAMNVVCFWIKIQSHPRQKCLNKILLSPGDDDVVCQGL